MADPTVSGTAYGDVPSGSGNGGEYTYQYQPNPDGSIGVYYFQNGQPITNAQYAAGTGQDTNAIEAYPQSHSVSGMDAPYAPTGNPTPTQDTTQQTSGGSTGGTGGAAPAPTTFSQSFGGTIYDDPAQYTNAVNSAAQTEYQKAMQSLNKQYESGLITYEERNQALEQNRTNIRTQAQDLMRSFGQNTKALGEQKTGSLQQQAGFFSAVAPDWTQSEEGVLANKTNDQFQQGTENLNLANQRNTEGINQALGGVDTAQGQLGREKTAYSDAYAENQGNLEQQRQGQIDNTLNNYLGAIGQMGADMGAVNTGQAPITPQTEQYNIMPYLQAMSQFMPQIGKSAASGQGFATKSNTPTDQDAYQKWLAGQGY